MQPKRPMWRTAALFALGAFLVGVPLQQGLVQRRPEQYRRVAAGGFRFSRIASPTPVLIASLGGFRTVAADLLWLKVDRLWEGGSTQLLPQVLESVVELDPHFILAWSTYGWHLAYNMNAESLLAADRRGWLEDGLSVLRRGVAENPDSYDMAMEYAWTLFDRAHDYYPAAEAFLAASKLKGADSKAIRFHYRCYEDLLDIKRLWPALKEAGEQFPNDTKHQFFCNPKTGRDTDYWSWAWNEPREHRRIIMRENNARRQRGLDPYLYPDNPYWNVCPVCGWPTEKGKPICENCGGYSFAERRLIAPPGSAAL